jgi:hypothetical protein
MKLPNEMARKHKPKGLRGHGGRKIGLEKQIISR